MDLNTGFGSGDAIMNLFKSDVISNRKKKTAQVLSNLVKDDEVVVAKAGSPIQIPGGHDQTYPFMPHPDYFWLTGLRRANGLSAFTKDEGWTDFIDPITQGEKVWEGVSEELVGNDVKSFESWLRGRKVVELAQGSDIEQNDLLQEAFNEVRAD